MTTPVLLVAYNRPGFTKLALESIYKLGQVRLYFSIDGPKAGDPYDSQKVNAVRELASSAATILPTRTLIRKHNLGGGRGVAEAIEWFFSFEEAGLIWEDDCVLHSSALQILDQAILNQLLKSNLLSISFANYLAGSSTKRKEDYRWSRYHLSGIFWSHRAAWTSYDLTLSNITLGYAFSKIFKSLGYRMLPALYWLVRLLLIKTGPSPNYWDYQFTILGLVCEGRHIQLNRNLVRNLGMNSSSSGRDFERFSWIAELPIQPLRVKIRHPEFEGIDHEKDRELEKEVFGLRLGRLVRTSLARLWAQIPPRTRCFNAPR